MLNLLTLKYHKKLHYKHYMTQNTTSTWCFVFTRKQPFGVGFGISHYAGKRDAKITSCLAIPTFHIWPCLCNRFASVYFMTNEHMVSRKRNPGPRCVNKANTWCFQNLSNTHQLGHKDQHLLPKLLGGQEFHPLERAASLLVSAPDSRGSLALFHAVVNLYWISPPPAYLKVLLIISPVAMISSFLSMNPLPEGGSFLFC